jgi:DNA-binding MarR family transcriptional regulator
LIFIEYSNNIITVIEGDVVIMDEEIAKEYIALIPNLFNSFKELNKDASELTHIQNHVIEFLYMQQRALNIKEISKGLGIAKQQLTNVISDLQMGGYLDKVPDPNDKRAVQVLITSKGKEIQQKKWTVIYQKFTNNLSRLTEEEKLDIAYSLHKVNVLLKKMEG